LQPDNRKPKALAGQVPWNLTTESQRLRIAVMKNIKWYYILAVALGLAAVVAIVFIFIRSGRIVERLGGRRSVNELEME